MGARYTLGITMVLALLASGACRIQQPGSTPQQQGGPPPQQQPPPQATSQPASQPPPSSQAVMQPQQQPQQQPTSQAVMQPQATSQGASQQMPSRSNFGTVTLEPGFVPDPHVVQGRSGGQSRARSRSSSCRGWIASAPDHLFDATGNFGSLRILAASDEDTTLVIMRPDGTFMCDDDGGQGRNPEISGQFPAGRYAIWVGSYREGVVAPYRLGFTELSSVTTQTVAGSGGGGGGGTGSNASNFGTVSLSSGFMPDPHVEQGVSGGSVQARQQVNSSCRGWIARRPDHIFVAETRFQDLRIMARSDADITLVVIDDAGNVWCNDDSEGLQPMVRSSFHAGRYRVWIGSYEQGVNARYSLGFSELNRSPSDLPSR